MQLLDASLPKLLQEFFNVRGHKRNQDKDYKFTIQ